MFEQSHRGTDVMITKKVKVVEHSMMGDRIIEEYERTFEDEDDLRGFLLIQEEYFNLNNVLKTRVAVEDVG